MEFLALAAVSFNQVLNLVFVAIGLGLVIFIHELGHFAVAKWCGVKVERFSIGFGPVLWKITRGETEYAISAIPFGGYVKMLGQDDADPSQLADTRVAADPRSYTSKSVPQRIAIIAAGVINNMVSAVVFFIIAFTLGVHFQPSVVGQVMPGMPAWVAGLRLGDQITRVGGRSDQMLGFAAVRQAVALSDGPLVVEGIRQGKPFKVTVHPLTDGNFPTIGIEGEQSLTLINDPEPVLAGTPAAAARPPFKAGDEIREVDGQPVESYFQLQSICATKRDRTLEFAVHRKGEPKDAPLVRIPVAPNPFRVLGLHMDIGKISALQEGSPAAQSGKLAVGDKLTHVLVDGRERAIGYDLNPLALPDYFAKLHGDEVTLRVKREVPAGDPVTVEVSLVPEDRPGWIERPYIEDAPISIPSLGIACHVLHHVLNVDPDGPAEGKILKGDNIIKVRFIASGADNDLQKRDLKFDEKHRNWPLAFWVMQTTPNHQVELTVKQQGSDQERVVVLVPTRSPDWHAPIRGFRMEPLSLVRRADSIGSAITLGFSTTRDQVIDMWLTIKGLLSRRISPDQLGGPITIARAAYQFSDRGLPDLILFLGILSVTLAVFNFLPIPVLDGGHFVFLAWEGLRGRPPSERVIITANYIGLALVLGLMVWVLYLDISRWVIH